MSRVAFTVKGPPVFTDDGVPRAKGRARAVPGQHPDGELFVRLVTPSDTRAAENAIRAAFRARFPEHRPWTGPVLLRFTAVFETPKSFNRALKEAAKRGTLMATRKPDKDNIEKLIVDALNGVCFVDDAQVMGGGMKRYGSPARLEVSFEKLDSPDVPPTPGQKRAERAQQAELPLAASRGLRANPTKSVSRQDLKVPPDLSGWSPRQRALIEAAMAREEASRKDRGK